MNFSMDMFSLSLWSYEEEGKKDEMEIVVVVINFMNLIVQKLVDNLKCFEMYMMIMSKNPSPRVHCNSEYEGECLGREWVIGQQHFLNLRSCKGL